MAPLPRPLRLLRPTSAINCAAGASGRGERHAAPLPTSPPACRRPRNERLHPAATPTLARPTDEADAPVLRSRTLVKHFPTGDARPCTRSTASTSRSVRGRSWAWWARAAPASRPSAGSCCASCPRPRAQSGFRGATSSRLKEKELPAAAGPTCRWCSRTPPWGALNPAMKVLERWNRRETLKLHTRPIDGAARRRRVEEGLARGGVRLSSGRISTPAIPPNLFRRPKLQLGGVHRPGDRDQPEADRAGEPNQVR